MEQQDSEITADQLKDSHDQMVRLRAEIEKASTEGEVVAAHGAYELAERSHRQLCARQAEQLRQIYFRNFYQRMRGT